MLYAPIFLAQMFWKPRFKIDVVIMIICSIVIILFYGFYWIKCTHTILRNISITLSDHSFFNQCVYIA
jgi:hypothetical protein